MKCPRRDPGSERMFPLPDTWCDDHTCSHCGSLDPVEFFRLVADGAEVGPTDKSYKAYVKHPGRDFGKMYFQHFSAEDQRLFVGLYNENKMKIGVPGHFYARPFFMVKATGLDAMGQAVKDNE